MALLTEKFLRENYLDASSEAAFDLTDSLEAFDISELEVINEEEVALKQKMLSLESSVNLDMSLLQEGHKLLDETEAFYSMTMEDTNYLLVRETIAYKTKELLGEELSLESSESFIVKIVTWLKNLIVAIFKKALELLSYLVTYIRNSTAVAAIMNKLHNSLKSLNDAAKKIKTKPIALRPFSDQEVIDLVQELSDVVKDAEASRPTMRIRGINPRSIVLKKETVGTLGAVEVVDSYNHIFMTNTKPCVMSLDDTTDGLGWVDVYARAYNALSDIHAGRVITATSILEGISRILSSIDSSTDNCLTGKFAKEEEMIFNKIENLAKNYPKLNSTEVAKTTKVTPLTNNSLLSGTLDIPNIGAVNFIPNFKVIKHFFSSEENLVRLKNIQTKIAKAKTAEQKVAVAKEIIGLTYAKLGVSNDTIDIVAAESLLSELNSFGLENVLDSTSKLRNRPYFKDIGKNKFVGKGNLPFMTEAVVIRDQGFQPLNVRGVYGLLRVLSDFRLYGTPQYYLTNVYRNTDLLATALKNTGNSQVNLEVLFNHITSDEKYKSLYLSVIGDNFTKDYLNEFLDGLHNAHKDKFREFDFRFAGTFYDVSMKDVTKAVSEIEASTRKIEKGFLSRISDLEKSSSNVTMGASERNVLVKQMLALDIFKSKFVPIKLMTVTMASPVDVCNIRTATEILNEARSLLVYDIKTMDRFATVMRKHCQREQDKK